MHFLAFRIAGRLRPAHVLVSVLALSVAVGTPGCWSKTSKQARKDLEKLKKQEKPKPPFDAVQVVTEPNERTFVPRKPTEEVDEEEGKTNHSGLPEVGEDEDILALRGHVKPGHWTGVLVTTTANEADFVGELASAPRNSAQQPVELESSRFYLQTSRPAALPKEQQKTLETMFFVPRVLLPDTRQSTWMSNQLRDRRRGTIAWSAMAEQFRHMPSYQYYMCVLARDSNRYRYFKVLDCVVPPLAMPLVVSDEQDNYRVLTPRPEAPLALPTRALAWTSIAYVVWDDMLPAVLSPEQQQAMLDWLHWGGSVIISGPRTLDSMRGTFLEPYLPALSAETTEIGPEALAELNRHWVVPGGTGQQTKLTPAEPWSGIKFDKHPDAEFLPGTGELVVERRVGRGRIVATAFRLSERELLNWRSYQSFVNGCLLRRLPRHFNEQIGEFEFVGPGKQALSDAFDAKYISAFRIYSRDAEAFDEDAKAPAPPPRPDPNIANNQFSATPNYGVFEEQDRLERMKAESGVGGWNDFSAVSTVARGLLRRAAGISVPNRSFVIWMVGLYLLIIVPINWLVFRLVGRVELAWLAVPVLAIGWGVAVVWLAQLDIGFARAETEVAVLEVQNGYPRAHLTRYMALYTSLSTTYDVHFADPSALAQPFARDRSLPLGEGRSTVSLRSAADQQLTDFVVSSNSTEMVHSEQMVNLNGALDWRQPAEAAPTLENSTRLSLSGVAVLRCRAAEAGEVAAPDDAESIVEGAWVGDLAPGDKVEVDWLDFDTAREEIDAGRETSAVTAKKPPDGALSLRGLIDLAEEPGALQPGDVRLVGWYDAGLPGVEADPSAPQARRKTMVLANLRFGDKPAMPDVNLRAVSQPFEE